MMATKKVKRVVSVKGPKKVVIERRDLTNYVETAMTRYGNAVNLDRALPDYRDGLKPVQRKILWAMYKMGVLANRPVVKSARIVGEVLGKYHPHGDTACYGAMVNMANQVLPPIDGHGNWGNLMKDPAAALRYTNARLSQYGASFFDPYYIPAYDLLPNYDDKDEEPLVLLAQLPNLLINGTYGIGVGTTSNVPSFTPGSVAKAVMRTLQLHSAGKKMSAKRAAQILKFTCPGRGVVDQEQQADAILTYMRTGEGTVEYHSTYTWDKARHAMVFTRFSPVDIGKAAQKVAEYKDVVDVLDESYEEKGVKHIVQTVVLKRLEGKLLDALKRKIANAFSYRDNLRTNVTERKLLRPGVVDVVNRSTTVPDILNDWCKWRVEVEVRATNYQIGVMQRKIRHTELLRLAVEHRKLIIQLLDSDKNDAQMEEALAKALKITVEEAKVIFDLRVRQLKRLEDQALRKTLAEQQNELKTLQGRAKNPIPWIEKNVNELVARLKGDIK
jgi:DNA gyrase subunit A